MPRSGGRGNSTDGNSVRKFFQNPVQGANILELDVTLVKRIGTALEVISSTGQIRIEEFREHTLETARLYVRLYPWYPMCPTLHKVLLHGFQFAKISPLPTGMYSEEAQESLHKIIRAFREDHTRTAARKDTNLDLFKRLQMWCDPIISDGRIKTRVDVFHSEEAEKLLY